MTVYNVEIIDHSKLANSTNFICRTTWFDTNQNTQVASEDGVDVSDDLDAQETNEAIVNGIKLELGVVGDRFRLLNGLNLEITK